MKILEDMRADFENMTSWFRENILYCLKTIKETTDHSERNGWALEQFFQIFCLHPALLLSENPVVVIPRICLFSTASSRLILSPIILLWQILWFLKIFRELLMGCWFLKHTDPSLHLQRNVLLIIQIKDKYLSSLRKVYGEKMKKAKSRLRLKKIFCPPST